jgi:hypothetical protein
MRPSLLASFALLLFCGAGPASAQGIKDPAEVMPARVLAYAELRQPGALVKEIAGLFENSALSNVPESLFKLLDEMKAPLPRRGLGELGAFGLLLSPEVVLEAQRLQRQGRTGVHRRHPAWRECRAPAAVPCHAHHGAHQAHGNG